MIAMLRKPLDLGLDLESPVLILRFFSRVNKLDMLNLLALDSVEEIDFPEKGRIDSMVAEVAMEQEASLPERFTGPKVQGVRRGEIIKMLLGKKSISVPFPDMRFRSGTQFLSCCYRI